MSPFATETTVFRFAFVYHMGWRKTIEAQSRISNDRQSLRDMELLECIAMVQSMRTLAMNTTLPLILFNHKCQLFALATWITPF